MLLPMEVDLILQKKGYKRNLGWPGGFVDSKMVLILQTKVVALYVKSFTVAVWGFGIELISKSNF